MDSQKALLVTSAPDGLAALNEHLAAGWRVVTTAPMGGGGQTEGFAALVVIEQTRHAADAVLEEIAEDIESVLEVGDGAGQEIPIDEVIERLSEPDPDGDTG